jgi:hypothetical protein
VRKNHGKKNRDKKILQKIRKTKSETREKQERGGVVVVCCSSKADEKPAQTTMTTTTNQTNRSRREERRERKEREREEGDSAYYILYPERLLRGSRTSCQV